MFQFAANLSFLFPSLPFPERFKAAAEAGFKGCEYLFPYDFEPLEIAEFLKTSGLTQVLFNLPPGDWGAGERGLAALPGREDEFAISVETALRYAEVTGCRRLHIMSGCAEADNPACHDVYLANITYAATRLRNAGITALIEPINPFDMPGYFLTEVDQARKIIRAVGAPNLKLQFDCYHRAMMGKDIIGELDRTAALVGHVQIAGMPGRHEPGTGTLDYVPIMKKLIQMGYEDWIGCEYRPLRSTNDGLSWRNHWLYSVFPKS